MLPHHEGPEPGYIACLLVLVTQSRANAIVALSRTLSIADGYVVEATTTAGQAAISARVPDPAGNRRQGRVMS